ncbi:PREDICTED: protein SODIUM POTASSIUM ROOT DEFECTIVE 1 [Tarenaya hassleriana]|uniref:protein SODIUM POTASSIUM ROOT DEFECTIVE 1 n=1 Tax=Tarenaya hassleriana TaxID=28532 RepID=UPI00053C59A7|nr:PREDICTED: protein SODIUM POTASSIUM ROOT DEFECTIVE 1 [Tarenaya hassleriana]
MTQTSSSSPAVRLGGRRRFTPPPSPNTNSSSSLHLSHSPKPGLNPSTGDYQQNSQEQNHATKKKKKKKKKTGLGNACIAANPQGSSRYLLDDPVFFDGFVDSDPVPVPVDPVFTDGSLDSDTIQAYIDQVDDGPEKTKLGFGYNEDRLIINASKYLSSSFLEKKQPDFFDGFLDYDPVLSPDNTVSHPTKSSPSETYREDTHGTTPDVQIQTSPPPPQEKKPSSDQVVVLRVSLHCKGCAGKVRKHLSRMKGVTSFNVDFAAKKVTVTGDVTPLGVLASVSKVKSAQFWPETIK